MKKFEHLDHTADIKFKVYAKSKEEIFANTVLAISDYLARGKKIKDVIKKKIKINGQDDESLLYAFIDELIYLLDAENFIVSKANIELKGNRLTAELLGDEAANYPGLDHIKAATYSEMHIKKEKNWEAQFVVDI